MTPSQDRAREVARELLDWLGKWFEAYDRTDMYFSDPFKEPNEKLADLLTSYASQQVLAARLEEAKWWQNAFDTNEDLFAKRRIAALEQQQAKE